MLYKIGIELNGIYFHSEISGGKDKYYHLNKTKYFNSLGVDIIHIFDSEWNEKKDIVKSLILSKLGLTCERNPPPLGGGYNKK